MYFVPANRTPSIQYEKNNLDENSINITSDKEVVCENTRFPENFMENLISLHSDKLRRKLYESYENSDVVKLLKEMKQIEENNTSGIPVTPVINGYKLIKESDPTPSDSIPLFTWGELACTPNLLNQTSNKFSIPVTPSRETLAHNLVNKSKKIIESKT